MNAMRWRQLAAVFRLEIGKSFLSRRGAWIYLLALVPILIFAGHAFISKRDRARNADQATAGVSRDVMRQVQPGMSREQLVTLLPNSTGHWTTHNRRGEMEWFDYSDGQTRWTVHLRDGQVVNVRTRGACNLAEDTIIFARAFQLLYLRLAIFFGCVFVFLNLFRGELLDKSLHCYFLAPVRREIVVAGKYLAGLAATTVIFIVSLLVQFWFLYSHLPAGAVEEYFSRGSGWHDSLAYVGVTALACLGYGGLFLAAGILVRNPLIPAAVILLWESINGILPSVLRQISVIYYLKSLCPVDIPLSQGVPPPLALLALNVDPAPAWVAIGGLIMVTGALLVFSARRVRNMEISYAAD